MTERLVETVRHFWAMNTGIEAIVVTGPAETGAAAKALADVEALFHATEARLSRFRADSELCALNASAGRLFEASPELFSAVSAAITAAESTFGLFDPTILDALLAAGYDRSFELLPDSSPPHLCKPRNVGTGRRNSWRAIALDPTASTIVMPAGCSIDLGGIGKGWTLDRAGELLAGFRNYAVGAGGDIVLSGTQAEGTLWSVGVQNPLSPCHDLMQLELSDCAVATSTVAQRRWLKDGRPQHHLIDPRTGLPAQSGSLACTVIAGSAVRAETLAKAALIAGAGAGIRFLDSQRDAEGLVVLDGGYVQRSRAFHGLSRVA